ncbi:hypothetical protein FGU65_02295 [Methanoculleus sp. FWC-SCC1]|uniref:PQQ-like domain-containing protein n=1 Tax=Methanoculleus frigidifontis TaxID=2584085 RepID=A0ABT8M741_9EURY|nr:hypothetical protein [Methanoculleus sp. FWC-SCC1]MDN7023736.1 hypothetical protein [Methanoculleus sp. FWC-SCC1]
MRERKQTYMRYALPAIGLLIGAVMISGCLFTASAPADLPEPPFRDASVIKFNLDGSIAWQTRLSFGRDTVPSSVTAMPNGSYAIAGQTVPGGENLSPPCSFAAMLDANGSLLWNRTLAPFTGPDTAASWETVLPDGSGGRLVAERAIGSIIVTRIGADGAVLWEQTVDEGDGALIWDISDLWETKGEIGVVYEVIRLGNDGSFETVVATFGPDGTPAGRRTLDAFTPVIRLPGGGYAFAAFPMRIEGAGSWYHYGEELHLILLDESGAVVRDTSVDFGEGSQTGSLVRTNDGGYIATVTHGPAGGIALPAADGGTAAISIAVGRG